MLGEITVFLIISEILPINGKIDRRKYVLYPLYIVVKLLIVKLSAIGDVIHCLPVANALKARLPGLHLTWLVEPLSADLLIDNPAVDDVIIFQAKSWLRQANKPRQWGSIWQNASALFKRLQEEKFDAVLEMQGLLKSALIAQACGAKIRIGFARTREFADCFLTHPINVGDYFGHYVPVVDLNLRIAEALLMLLGGDARLPPIAFPLPVVSSAVRDKMLSIIANGKTNQPAPIKATGHNAPDAVAPVLSHHMGTEPICVLIPGTTWTSKSWPSESWFQLGQKIASLGYRLILIGGKSELATNRLLAERLRNHNDCDNLLDLTDSTTLLDLIYLFRKTDIVIGCDTGPLHLAAAVNKPKVVGIYGSTPWRRNGPYGDHCRSVSLEAWCQPCYRKVCPLKTIHCLTDLPVKTVFDAVLAMVQPAHQLSADPPN